MTEVVKGMKVWSLIHGKGKIASHDVDWINAVFHGGQTMKFDKKSGAMPGYQTRCLYFSEPKIVGDVDPPYIPKFKHREMVIVSRDSDGGGGVVISVGYENKFCVTSTGGKDYPKAEYNFFRIGEMI